MAKTSKSNNSPKLIQVDIVSDIVCPWCWLGSKYFLKAAKKTKHSVQLSWRPYMLDPTVPESGVPYGEYMKKKFGTGSNDRFKSMRDHLEKSAPAVGINFRFDEIPMRPNTLDAHRLIRWADGQGLGTAAAEALFKTFFDDLKDVGDKQVLSAIAGNIGLDSELVTELLDGDQDKNAVKEEIMFFRNLGVTGVPCFIYQGQFAVQGAQEPEAHLKALEQAATIPTPS